MFVWALVRFPDVFRFYGFLAEKYFSWVILLWRDRAMTMTRRDNTHDNDNTNDNDDVNDDTKDNDYD